jgi:hypothetical protein
MNANDFSKIDAQDGVSRLAQMDPREVGDDMTEFDGEPEPDGEPMGSHDLSDDAEALASAGHGTDEDYGGGTHMEDYGSE